MEFGQLFVVSMAILLPVSWLLVCLAASSWIAEKWRGNAGTMRLTERLARRKPSQGVGLLGEAGRDGLEEVAVELR